MLTINDLKNGVVFIWREIPYQVLSARHIKLGRGGAILQTKIKNLTTGNVQQENFKASDKFEEANLEKVEASFLYRQGNDYYFMNEITYDQFALNQDELGIKAHFLKEGQNVKIIQVKEKVISIELPPKIDLKVTQAPPGVKGDTAQGSVTKAVTLETGLVIQAPLFIKEGDTIRVNTETGEYVERVS